MVWESLHNVDGDSCFCDSDFHLSHSLGEAAGAEGAGGSPEKQLQVDQVCVAFGKGTSVSLLSELWALSESHGFYHLVAMTSHIHAPLLSVPCGPSLHLVCIFLAPQRLHWLFERKSGLEAHIGPQRPGGGGSRERWSAFGVREGSLALLQPADIFLNYFQYLI